MSDVRLERDYPVTPARLFEVVSTRAALVQWWGHAGWRMQDEHLDFTREGPWHSQMLSEEGNLFRMSGQVTSVRPITTIGFTWGWDEPPQMRQGQSHVTFTVEPAPKGARLIIDHRDLPNDEIAAGHKAGWGGPLAQLDQLLAKMDLQAEKEKDDG